MATDAPPELTSHGRGPALGRFSFASRTAQCLDALVSAKYLGLLPLAAVVTLSLAMNIWRLGRAGYGNTYYAAAVRSMTLSWSNFFFGSFDPGGFITVDKPPVFLWFGAISARLFGYSTWSILLPSAIAGTATVALLWLIVRRHFGGTAATVAAVALALTPISVAVDRLNLPEPFFILMLVGAAGAVLHSLEARRWWLWTALAGLLVGLAFNSKMLAGWIPGPAFVLALLAGWAGPWRAALRPTLGRLAVLGVVTLLASASWMLIVDRWPEGSRPYIGGSTDNTVQDLVLGYNGISRVDGDGQGFNRNRGAQPPADPPAPNRDGGQPPGPVGPPPPGFGPGGSPPGPGGPPPPGPGGVTGPGGIIAGTPGPWRMFDAANGGQIAWLIPFALIGSLIPAVIWRGHPVRRAAIVLWAGWLLLHGGIFSFAEGIYHSYYTAAMAPGIAALAGINAVAAAEAVRRHRAWLALIAVAVAVTVLVQLDVVGRQPDFFGWMRPYVVVGAIAGVGILALAMFWRRVPRYTATAGLGIALAALFLLPGGWSLSEASQPPLNSTLPQAGPRQGAAGRTFGSQAFDDGTAALAAWLESHSDGARWDLAVTSAQVGSPLIARHSLSVMAIGGFSGRDNSITIGRFAEHVAHGEVRYVSVENIGPGGPPPPPGRAGGPGAPGGPPPPDGRGQPPAFPGAPPPNGRQPGFAPQNPAPGAPRPPQPAPPPGRPLGQAPGQPPGQQPPGQRGGVPRGAGSADILSAVRAACAPVRDPALPPRFQSALYDCAGKAEALTAAGR